MNKKLPAEQNATTGKTMLEFIKTQLQQENILCTYALNKTDAKSILLKAGVNAQQIVSVETMQHAYDKMKIACKKTQKYTKDNTGFHMAESIAYGIAVVFSRKINQMPESFTQVTRQKTTSIQTVAI